MRTTTPVRRAPRARRVHHARHAIPCIAVVLTLGDAVQRWQAQRPTATYPPCVMTAERPDHAAPRPTDTIRGSKAATDSLVAKQ